MLGSSYPVKASREHREFLSRKDFVRDCSAPNLTSRDRQLLTRYGHWLSALAGGKIQPSTPARQHFVQGAEGKAEAQTEFEKAWSKLVERRKFEAESRVASHFEFSDPAEEWISRQESWRSKAGPR
jgi:uncharacterized protein YifE (UPF0438 family)